MFFLLNYFCDLYACKIFIEWDNNDNLKTRMKLMEALSVMCIPPLIISYIHLIFFFFVMLVIKEAFIFFILFLIICAFLQSRFNNARKAAKGFSSLDNENLLDYSIRDFKEFAALNNDI